MDIDRGDLNSHWLNFIKDFFSTQFDITFNEMENGWIKFEILKFFDLKLEISNRYGFFSIKFKNQKQSYTFLSLAGINYQKEKVKSVELVETSWLKEEYPCRVYVSSNNKVVSFYDKTEPVTNDEFLHDRISSFRNIISALVQIQVDSLIEKYLD